MRIKSGGQYSVVETRGVTCQVMRMQRKCVFSQAKLVLGGKGDFI